MSVLDFTEVEMKLIRKTVDGDIDYDDLPESLTDKLYDHFMDEMPIGTAKARTGDPSEWILDHLHELL